jgi:hypothetical protein
MTEPIRRPEPEIIPPGAPLPHGSRIWMSTGATGTYHTRTMRIGPLGTILLTLGIGAAAAAGLFILLGAALVSLAAIGLVTIGTVVAGLLRGPNQPLR